MRGTTYRWARRWRLRRLCLGCAAERRKRLRARVLFSKSVFQCGKVGNRRGILRSNARGSVDMLALVCRGCPALTAPDDEEVLFISTSSCPVRGARRLFRGESGGESACAEAESAGGEGCGGGARYGAAGAGADSSAGEDALHVGAYEGELGEPFPDCGQEDGDAAGDVSRGAAERRGAGK